MIDEQQNSSKQGLTPSPSSAFSATNPNDNTNAMKFLMVPGQNVQMGSFSSGKHITFDVHATYIAVVWTWILFAIFRIYWFSARQLRILCYWLNFPLVLKLYLFPVNIEYLHKSMIKFDTATNSIIPFLLHDEIILKTQNTTNKFAACFYFCVSLVFNCSDNDTISTAARIMWKTNDELLCYHIMNAKNLAVLVSIAWIVFQYFLHEISTIKFCNYGLNG